jgi:predicted PurR-regulated permease PerM
MALASAEGVVAGLDPRTLRVVWTVAVVAAAGGLVYALRHLIVLVVFSVFFAYLLYPLVRRLERRMPTRYGCQLALVLTYALLALAIAIAVVTLGPRLSAEVRAIAQRFPAMTADLQSGVLVRNVLTHFGVPESTADAVFASIRNHAGEWLGAAQRGVTAMVAWAAGAWVVVLVPIFAFFILSNSGLVVAAGRFLENREHRLRWRRIAYDLHDIVGQYVRALLLLALATFVVWSAVLSLAGVPYSVLLAGVAGVFEFVPLVGPLIAAVATVIVCLLSGYPHPWLIAGFVAGWRLVQDYVTSPLVMGRGIDLPPAVVILAILAGDELAGPVGMFLAVPVVAAARIVWRDLREPAPALETGSSAVRRIS